MTEYFLRYTENAEADIERGYSFVGYMLFETEREALENVADLTGAAYEDEDFDLAGWCDENAHLVGQDNTTGRWGQRRSGLCGYGPFASVEEAREFIGEGGDCTTQNGAIFSGFEVLRDSEVDGQDEGITFRPVEIIEVFSVFQSARYCAGKGSR